MGRTRKKNIPENDDSNDDCPADQVNDNGNADGNDIDNDGKGSFAASIPMCPNCRCMESDVNEHAGCRHKLNEFIITSSRTRK